MPCTFRVDNLLRRYLAVQTLVLMGIMMSFSSHSLAAVLPTPSTNALSLHDFIQLVVERNEKLQLEVLTLKIARKKYQAERGTFEPELILSYNREENKRENTAEQRRSSGVLLFDEKNNVYNAGIEALVPSGAKIRIGYLLRDLRNNLQDPQPGTIVTNTPRGEFQTFAGINLTQPLLKNAWLASTMANIRLAAADSEAAYQEYRRQMMLVVTTAEAAYWNLYLAQEQVRFFRESVDLAENLAQDEETRFQSGQGSELDVMEARAGLALRKTRLGEAEQNWAQTSDQLMNLIARTPTAPASILRATDAPHGSEAIPQFTDCGRMALTMNPDYLSQIQRSKQEDVRLAYAKNQRLPQLDLTASFGLNGLGPDPGSSWDDIEHGGFPSFSVGVEWHVPLGGGIRSRHELEAARLRKRQALVSLSELETQILNGINTSLQKIRSTYGTIQDYQQIAAFNQSLLDTEMDRYEVGRTNLRRVLDVQSSLFEASNSVVEAQVKNERARLELELIQGTVLKSRNLDLPRTEVESRTDVLLKGARKTQYDNPRLLEDLQLDYRKPLPWSDSNTNKEPVISHPSSVPPPSRSDPERLRHDLRQAIDDSNRLDDGK